MSKPAPSRRRSLIGRFVRARRGSTAVEFAMIAFPLMLLLFGVLELAMVFMASATLEDATEGASRRIRTGEFQQGGASSKSDFVTSVCSGMSWLSAGCSSTLHVDVQTFASYADAANAKDDAFKLNPNTATCFSPGNPRDIVMVRTFMEWKLFTPLLSGALANMGGSSGKRLLISTTAFRNEPFGSAAPKGASCT